MSKITINLIYKQKNLVQEYNSDEIERMNNDIHNFIKKNDHSKYDYFLSGVYGDYIPGIFNKSNYIHEKLKSIIFSTKDISTYYINFYDNSTENKIFIQFNKLPQYKFIIYKN